MNITGSCRPGGPDEESFGDVLRSDRDYFPRPWTENDWQTLDWKRHLLFVFSENGRFTGFALFSTPDETAHLLKILILPEFRGTGSAGRFWSEITRELRARAFQTIYLEVEESNERARNFYEKSGFLTLRKARSYYSDGQAARMMQLTL